MHRHLSATTVFQDGDKRHNRVMRKVRVVKGIARLVEDLTLFQANTMQMGRQIREIVGLQSGEKPVRPVVNPRSFGDSRAT
jgi:hypothetical protein